MSIRAKHIRDALEAMGAKHIRDALEAMGLDQYDDAVSAALLVAPAGHPAEATSCAADPPPAALIHTFGRGFHGQLGVGGARPKPNPAQPAPPPPP